VPTLRSPPQRGTLLPLSENQTGCLLRHARAAGLRAVPAPRTGSPPLRALRQHRVRGGARPRRRARCVPQLLPPAPGRLLPLRTPAALQLRRHRAADLQAMRPQDHRHLRPLST
jgi:hypothetical protein